MDKRIKYSIILFVVYFFSAFPYIFFNITGDISEYLNNPFRVLNGDLPYKDFWLLFPPGEVYFPALIYKIFGININIVLVFSVLISSLCGVYSFILVKENTKNIFYAFLASFLIYYAGIVALNIGHTYLHLHFLLQLISVHYFLKYLNEEKENFILRAGILIGISLFFKVFLTGALLVALIICLIVLHKKKLLLKFIIGVICSASVFYLPFIKILPVMIKQLLIQSVQHGTAIDIPYFCNAKSALKALLADFRNFKKINGIYILSHTGYFLTAWVYYLLPVIVSGIFIYYFILHRKVFEEKIILLLFFLWGAFAFIKAVKQSDLTHLSPSISAFIFLIIFMRIWVGIRVIKWVLDILIFILLLKMPLFYGKTLKMIWPPVYRVNTVRGILLYKNQTEAESLTWIIKFVEENTSQKDYIFVTPWYAPPIYALTSRKNPTYYDSFIDLIYLPSVNKQKRVCNELTLNFPKVIIHGTGFWWGWDKDFIEKCPLIEKFINTKYTLIAKKGRYKIYIPKNDK